MKNRAAIIIKQFEIINNTYNLDLYLIKTETKSHRYVSELLKSEKLDNDLEEKIKSLKSELKSRDVNLEPIFYETKLLCGMSRNELIKIMRGDNIG